MHDGLAMLVLVWNAFSVSLVIGNFLPAYLAASCSVVVGGEGLATVGE
tara:strand:- start:368 stop:511 length:144 start_codon:yes stop_codon:yes gene_type:complete